MTIIRDIFTGLIGLALIAASCYIIKLYPDFWPQVIGLLWLAGKIFIGNETANKISGAFLK